MDDRELEARLAARLHERFDGATLPPAMAAEIWQGMTTPARPVGAFRIASFRTMPLGLLAAALVVAVLAVFGSGLLGPQIGPGPQRTPLPTASFAPERQFIVLPPNLQRADKASASHIGDILNARLRALGYETFTSAIGNAFLFIVPADGPSDGATRRTLGSNGVVTFVPLPAADYGDGKLEARIGVPLPKDEPALFGWDGIESASLAEDQQHRTTVAVTLRPAARDAFGAYTTTHIGESFAILVDGIVVLVPGVAAPIVGGQVELSGGGLAAGDTEDRFPELAAILVGGPLPPEWFGLFSPATIDADAAKAVALGLYQTATVEHAQLDARAVLDGWEAVWAIRLGGDLPQSCPALTPGASCSPVEGALTVYVDGDTGEVVEVRPSDP